MKKQKPTSVRFNIPEPCHEKWSDMTPVHAGRFCHQCDRHIVNFSQMSDHELAVYYQQQDGKICGVFRADQLNKDIVLPSPSRKVGYWKAAAVATGMILSGGVAAQQVKVEPQMIEGQRKMGKVAFHTNETAPERVAKGMIIDIESNEPLIFASILIAGTKKGTITDIEGEFELTIPREIENPILEVSYTGYATQRIDNISFGRELLIEMEMGVQLDDVIIMGYMIPAPKQQHVPELLEPLK